MDKINNFVNRYFGLILFIASISGLMLPDFHINFNLVIVVELAFIIFVSFFKIDIKTLFKTGNIKLFLLFYLFRFVVLPIIMFYSLNQINSYYAVVIFILLSLPTAMSSPAFANMFGGNITLTLKILVITSFMSIVVLPLLCKYILHNAEEIDVTNMFYTMIYTIVLPFFIHLPFKRSRKITYFFTLNSPILIVSGLSAIYMLAIIKNKHVIIQDPIKVVVYALISVGVFLILYIIFYYIMKNQKVKDRISFSICAGANNIGLGVAITALYFSESVNVFFITAQLAWIIALIPIRYFFYSKNI